MGKLQFGCVMMTIPAGAGALDYSPCRYGAARATFRGPARDLRGPYVAMLGGSSTFGKYVAAPFPDLVEQALGRTVVNLGGQNAGPDFYLADRGALDVAGRARVAVMQVTGAEALSNPWYMVHSRRNDRVLAVSPELRTLFPEIDFAEIHFTRPLLSALQAADACRFKTVVDILQETWVVRMNQLLTHLPPRRLLLWLSDAAPPETALSLDAPWGPLLVDSAMIEALGPAVTKVVQVMPTASALVEGAAGLSFPQTEAVQARSHPGSAVHAEVAARLAPLLGHVM